MWTLISSHWTQSCPSNGERQSSHCHVACKYFLSLIYAFLLAILQKDSSQYSSLWANWNSLTHSNDKVTLRRGFSEQLTEWPKENFFWKFSTFTNFDQCRNLQANIRKNDIWKSQSLNPCGIVWSLQKSRFQICAKLHTFLFFGGWNHIESCAADASLFNTWKEILFVLLVLGNLTKRQSVRKSELCCPLVV